jgi:hypothetical protein
VLKISSPKYKGISNLTIKCIAQKQTENNTNQTSTKHKKPNVETLLLGKSIAPYRSVVFVFWVLFAFLVVKRGFHASFFVFLCRFLSQNVGKSRGSGVERVGVGGGVGCQTIAFRKDNSRLYEGLIAG